MSVPNKNTQVRAQSMQLINLFAADLKARQEELLESRQICQRRNVSNFGTT